MFYLETRYFYEFKARSDEVYLIQHYVIKLVCDLWQASGFLWAFRFPQPSKLTGTI